MEVVEKVYVGNGVEARCPREAAGDGEESDGLLA